MAADAEIKDTPLGLYSRYAGAGYQSVLIGAVIAWILISLFGYRLNIQFSGLGVFVIAVLGNSAVNILSTIARIKRISLVILRAFFAFACFALVALFGTTIFTQPYIGDGIAVLGLSVALMDLAFFYLVNRTRKQEP